MKLIVETEEKSKVVDSSGNVMYKGTRLECLDFIADVLESGLRVTKKH